MIYLTFILYLTKYLSGRITVMSLKTIKWNISQALCAVILKLIISKYRKY